MFAARGGFFAQSAASDPNPRRVGTSSTNASVTWTPTSATTSTAQKQFGTASMLINGNDTYQIQSNTSSFLNVGSGEFAIEWWIYIPSSGSWSTTASCDLLSNDTGYGFGIRLAKQYDNNGLGTGNQYIACFARQQADLTYWTLSSTWTRDTWHHCVMQRKGTTMSFWWNGQLQTGNDSNGAAGTYAFASSGTNVKIGTADGGNGIKYAYIDEICFSNTYRYSDTTIDISVPTAAYTLDSYTNQLLHLDGTNGGTTFTNVTS